MAVCSNSTKDIEYQPTKPGLLSSVWAEIQRGGHHSWELVLVDSDICPEESLFKVNDFIIISDIIISCQNNTLHFMLMEDKRYV